jgi:hypothetical protein
MSNQQQGSLLREARGLLPVLDVFSSVGELRRDVGLVVASPKAMKNRASGIRGIHLGT